MALNFYTQGVDFSGLGQGIARGLEQAANMRMQQDQIVRKEIDDFKSTYDTGKMMAKDTPLFATEFENYRKTAIEYAKMNRGRVKAADLTAKKAQLDSVRGKLNSVYENSAKGASVLDGLVKYADRMTAAGYALPDDMNKDIIKLKTQPIDKINFEELKAPTAYEFEANDDDFTGLDKEVSSIKDNKDEESVGSAFKISLGEKDTPGYEEIDVPQMEKFTRKDSSTVLGKLTTALTAKARLKNAAVNQKNALISTLNSKDSDVNSLINKQLAERTKEKILIAYPQLKGDINNVLPEMVIAANRGYLDRNVSGKYISMKEFDAKFKLLKQSDLKKYQKLRQAAIGSNKKYAPSYLFNTAAKTGGKGFSNEVLEDMGFTKAEMEEIRKGLVQFAKDSYIRPGDVNYQ